MAGIGLEKRTSILPTKQTGPGLFGPDYSFSDNIPLPGEIGVRDGDSMGSVIDSLKAVSFYVDTIGFGEASNPLSKGMPLKPLGVNTWMKSGMTCSNGAEAWTYVEGIPKGDALGQRVKKGLESAGLPGMRGLAPGIMEDAKSALDPRPILGAVFGSGNVSCRLEKKKVGDQDNRIQNPESKKFYVEDPDTVVYENGVPYQSRWIEDTSLTYEEWKSKEKTHCPNGLPKTAYQFDDCLRARKSVNEGFEPSMIHKGIVCGLVIGAAFCIRLVRGK